MNVISKKITALLSVLFCCTALLLSGCGSKKTTDEIQTDSLPDKDNEITITEPAKIDGESGDITGIQTTINIFINDKDGSSTVSGLSPAKNLNEGLDLTIDYGCDPSIVSGRTATAPVDIFVFCNGYIIKHSANPGEEASVSTRRTVTLGGAVNSLPVYIPPVSIGETDLAYLWVCVVAFPEYIPKSVFGEISTITEYYVPVYSSGIPDANYSVYKAQENEYIYGHSIHDTGGSETRIGPYDETRHTTARRSAYDTAEIGPESDFCVVSYYGEQKDFDCYTVVFCNGKLISPFNGKTFLKTDYDRGSRMVKFSFDKNELPEDGVYSYMAVTFPSDIGCNNPDEGNIQSFSNLRQITLSLGS